MKPVGLVHVAEHQRPDEVVGIGSIRHHEDR
jgi:hypothetical protein